MTQRWQLALAGIALANGMVIPPEWFDHDPGTPADESAPAGRIEAALPPPAPASARRRWRGAADAACRRGVPSAV